MGIGCGAYMAKCLLFIFNTAFFLAGGALMGIGIWIRVDPRTADFTRIISVNANDPLLQTAAIALAVVGALVFLTGFLGCCGALCSNTCMLMMYAVIVVILAIGQVVAGILAAVFSRRVGDTIKQSMRDGLNQYNGNSLLSRSWDSMQVWLKCCGTDGPLDWAQNSQMNVTWLANYPPSCCTLKNSDPNDITTGNMVDPGSCQAGLGGYNQQGCYNGLLDWVRRNAGIIIGVAFGLIALQVLVVCLACCLRKAIKEDEMGKAV